MCKLTLLFQTPQSMSKVPSQPTNIRVVPLSSSTIQVSWSKPSDDTDHIIGYEIYWNDTFTDSSYHRAIPDVESYILVDLFPDTVYFIWVAAKTIQGEGAATTPIAARTEQYGE